MHGTVARIERKIDENGIDKALIPGIYNIQSVGSSPLKRGAKNLIQMQDRDGIYVQRGAGQVSSITNTKKFILPSFERQRNIGFTSNITLKSDKRSQGNY